MNQSNLFKTFIIVVVFAYLSINDNQAEARTLNELQNLDTRNVNMNDLSAMAQLIEESKLSNPLEQADNDDDEDDDDRSNLQLQNPLMVAGPASLYNDNQRQPILAEQTTQQQNKIGYPSTSSDLKTSASHHHHGHGVKGWLDMGAWTGKKGAFGWHDKHPVGGKGRK